MDDPKPVTPEKQPEPTGDEPDAKPAALKATEARSQEPVGTPIDSLFDDKQPETYVNSAGEPVKIAPAGAAPQTAKQKSGAGKWLAGGLVILLLAALGAVAYWQYTEAEAAKSERASLQSELDTVKNANKQGDSSDKKTLAEPVVLAPKQEVALAVNEYLEARADDEFEVSDSGITVNDNFAKAIGLVSGTTEGGYTLVLKKVKDAWVVIYGGVGMTTEQKNNLVKEFEVPASLLAES